MKIFIFPHVSELTSGYHDGGGLVVIATNELAAKDLMYRSKGQQDFVNKVTMQEWAKVKVYDLVGADIPEQIFVFPDRGCCG